MATHPDDPLHVAQCSTCQAGVDRDTLDVDFDRVWNGIAGHVWARPVGVMETTAGRLLQSPGLARALVTAPSLVLSWLVATAVVLATGAAVTLATGYPWVAVLAPAMAGAGIAYAYGPGVDPAYELSQSMPISAGMVLLVRVLAVFAVNAMLGALASLVSEGAAGITFGWLIPMTTVAALGLAAATLARSANVGVAAALAGWCIVVLATAVGTHDLTAAVEQGVLTPAYLAATLACAATILYASSGRRIGLWQ
jgi:hypothetical protein